MRPNIDIPWDLHGRIKEYSNQNNWSLEKAYADLLRRGLDAAPTEGGSSLPHPSPDDTIFIPIQERGVAKIFLFSRFSPFEFDDPVAISANTANVSLDRAENILGELKRLMGGGDGSFSFQQVNAGWYGRGGLADFLYWLENPDELYRDVPEGFELDRHKSGSAVYISDTAFPARYVVIHALPSKSGTLDKFGVTFFTDGTPVMRGRFAEFARKTDMKLSHAKSWTPTEDPEATSRAIVCEHFGEYRGAQVDPVKYDTDQEDDIRGFLTLNPFYEGNKDTPQDHVNNDQLKWISNLEYLYSRLKHSADMDMETDFEVTGFSAANLGRIPKAPFSIVNINYESNW
jgi:hypothetical protein